MPYNYDPENDTFTTYVELMSDSDAPTGASVRSPLIDLADRTRWLKNRRDEMEAMVRTDLSRGCYLSPAKAGIAGGVAADWTIDPATGLATGLGQAHGLIFDVRPGESLPFSCVVDTVRVLVKPGTARSPLARMAIRVSRINSDFTLTQIGSDVEDNGTTSTQTIVISGINLPLTATPTNTIVGTPALGMLISVFAGNGGDLDTCYMAEVNCSDVIL